LGRTDDLLCLLSPENDVLDSGSIPKRIIEKETIMQYCS
jgi:hypothetical protein